MEVRGQLKADDSLLLPVGPGDRTQAVWLGEQHPYLLSHAVRPLSSSQQTFSAGRLVVIGNSVLSLRNPYFCSALTIPLNYLFQYILGC